MARREMSTDPRAVRTRATLIETTISLLGSHSSESLSVSQIVKEGGLSRQVFYEHFADRDALLVAAAEHILAPATEWAKENAHSVSEPELIEGVFTKLQPHHEALRNLINGPVHWQIHSFSVEQIRPFMEESVRTNLKRNGIELSERHISRTADLLAGGVVGLVFRARKEDRSAKETREDIDMVSETLSALDYRDY